MSFTPTLLAILLGYLLGSVSFARLVGRRVAPGEDITVTEIEIGQSERSFTYRGVSATSLSMRSGPKAGCLTSLLDIAKAALPTLLIRWWFPEQPYFLLTAAAAVLGHNYPLYHRFIGGRGASPMIGGLLVIDWVSLPVTLLGSNLIGLFGLRDIMAAYMGFPVLLFPWFWYRGYDWPYFAYAAAITLLYFVAAWPEIKLYLSLRREGVISRSMMAQLEGTDMGRPLKYMRRFGLIPNPAEPSDPQNPTPDP